MDKYANQPCQLLPLSAHPDEDDIQITLPMNFTDYLTLVEWTSQPIRDDKKGAIPIHLTPILQRLTMDESQGSRGSRQVLYSNRLMHYPYLVRKYF